MTKQLTRYSIGVSISEELDVDSDTNGKWVKYEDIRPTLEALSAKIAKLERLLGNTVASILNKKGEPDELRQIAEALNLLADSMERK